MLVEAGLSPLNDIQLQHFSAYLDLLQKWNARLNLTAIRDEDGILARHFLEGIACAQALPSKIANVLDFGSGAGFPGIPIAICRPEMEVTLAESQNKKAAFLQEAVRILGLKSKVLSGRAETLQRQFDCVTLRAVDRMEAAVKAAASLVRLGGWLAPMTTVSEFASLQSTAGFLFQWQPPIPLPASHDRILALGTRTDSSS